MTDFALSVNPDIAPVLTNLYEDIEEVQTVGTQRANDYLAHGYRRA